MKTVLPAGPRTLTALIDRLRGEDRLGDLPGSGAGQAGVELTGVADDSRKVEPGNLFVAVRGLRTDGHQFLAQAIERGAVAVVVEESAGDLPVPQLIVDRGAAALASAAAWWYGDPSRELLTVGVTGTNGKTTTSFLAAAGLAGAGFATGLIGTIGIRIGGEFVPQRGAQHDARRARAAADPPSDGRRGRAGGRHRDELARPGGGSRRERRLRRRDLHQPVARAPRLPRHVRRVPVGEGQPVRAAAAARGKGDRPGLGVINADDPHANAFVDATRGAKALPVTYGTRLEADIRLLSLKSKVSRSRLKVQVGGATRQLDLRMPGAFNAHNAMAVLGLAHGWGLDLDAVSAALEAVAGVPGRMERIDLGQPFMVVVDYAHTSASLDAVLRELQPLAAKGRGVISVFGASGERDVGKRPLMGEAAAKRSRLVIVTEDDSRGEDPASIFDAIAARRGGRRQALGRGSPRHRRPPRGHRRGLPARTPRRHRPPRRQGPRNLEHGPERPRALVGSRRRRATARRGVDLTLGSTGTRC